MTHLIGILLGILTIGFFVGAFIVQIVAAAHDAKATEQLARRLPSHRIRRLECE